MLINCQFATFLTGYFLSKFELFHLEKTEMTCKNNKLR